MIPCPPYVRVQLSPAYKTTKSLPMCFLGRRNVEGNVWDVEMYLRWFYLLPMSVFSGLAGWGNTTTTTTTTRGRHVREVLCRGWNRRVKDEIRGYKKHRLYKKKADAAWLIAAWRDFQRSAPLSTRCFVEPRVEVVAGFPQTVLWVLWSFCTAPASSTGK